MAYLTIITAFAVAFINGFTDAPNSIAACVATNVLPLKKALRIAAISDFCGTLSIGLLSGKVSERIILLADFGTDDVINIISVFSSMLAAVIWSVFAWYFGIPTSESHAMIAGIFGASSAVNNGTGNINTNEWIEVLSGLTLSIIIGFIGSYLLSKAVNAFMRSESNNFLRKFQILSAITTSFLHGAQDSQKFIGIIMTVLISLNSNFNCKYSYTLITIICGTCISAGVATGGDRIITTVGNNMVKLNNKQGFSADTFGLICLLISTLYGLPVSTTHIKTVSVIGAAKAGGKVNRKTVSMMFMSWIVTFPVCSFLSYVITYIIIK